MWSGPLLLRPSVVSSPFAFPCRGRPKGPLPPARLTLGGAYGTEKPSRTATQSPWKTLWVRKGVVTACSLPLLCSLAILTLRLAPCWPDLYKYSKALMLQMSGGFSVSPLKVSNFSVRPIVAAGQHTVSVLSTFDVRPIQSAGRKRTTSPTGGRRLSASWLTRLRQEIMAEIERYGRRPASRWSRHCHCRAFINDPLQMPQSAPNPPL